jgi:spore coat protein CotH
MFLTAIGSWATAASLPIPGDVDLSGRLDALDVQLVLNAALGSQSAASADIDYSGAVDASDVQLVINAVLGITIDSDADGLSDVGEANIGTDPALYDTDEDGAPDGYEVCNSTDPLQEDGPHYGLIFKQDVVEEYEVILTREDYQTLENDLRSKEYVPGTVIIGGHVFENVGIRYKGSSSLIGLVGLPKKPFKIDFDRFVDGQHFAGIKKLNLNNGKFDASLMRERLAYEIFADAGSPASHSSHVNFHLTVPGLYDRLLIGIYTMVEQVDKRYLAQWFSDNDGNLYKSGDSGANLSWRGDDKESYRPYYDKKTNEAEDDWSDLIHFIDVLNNTPDEQFKTEVEQVFNVDGFLTYLAANTVLANMDSIAGREANYYLYNNPDTGLFEFLPWDLNMAFGRFGNFENNATLDIFQPTTNGRISGRPLVNRVLAVPDYVDVYEARIRGLIEGSFSPGNMNARIDDVYTQIREFVYASEHNLDSDEDFEASVSDDGTIESAENLRNFVAIRVESINGQL